MLLLNNNLKSVIKLCVLNKLKALFIWLIHGRRTVAVQHNNIFYRTRIAERDSRYSIDFIDYGDRRQILANVSAA